MKKHIWATWDDFFRTIFSDADQVSTFPYNGFKKGKNLGWLLYRASRSRFLPTSLSRRLWLRYVLKQAKLKKGDAVIIVNNAMWSPFWDGDVIPLLRKRGCVVISLLLDAVYAMGDDLQKIVLEAARSSDLVFTYDREDAKRFHWQYTDCYYSKPQLPVGDTEPTTDVFCVMRTKGRLEQIVAYYDALTARGLRCSFYLLGVTPEEEAANRRSGIVYNRFLTYSEILQKDREARILLELGMAGQKSSTLRYYEAVSHGKKLITSCAATAENRLYNERYIRVVSSPADIEKLDEDFFKNEAVDYGYRNDFSPDRLFEAAAQLGKLHSKI